MAGSPSSSYPGFPSLSPDQQKLLLAALTSNSQSGRQLNMDEFHSLSSSANQQAQSSALLDDPTAAVDPAVLESYRRTNGAPVSLSAQPAFGEGLLPDFINDHNNADFDVDVELPGATDDLDNGFPFESAFDGENGEKRKSPEDDDDDDDDDEYGSFKRRESDEKGPKKPGRKPLTSEPTTKRKAQNRAAQRAFRERKEKHLKDLEQKVADLERASESTNHENDLLKAQIARLQVEVQDYRKRLSHAGSVLNGSPPPPNDGSSPFRNDNNRTSSSSFEFPFEFPYFGTLPPNGSISNGDSSAVIDPNQSIKQEPSSRSNSNATTPQNSIGLLANSASPPSISSNSSSGLNGNYNTAGDTASGSRNHAAMGFSALGSPTNYVNGNGTNTQNLNRNNSTKFPSNSDSSTSNADSPSNSSVSHHGPGSSAATSPEPVQTMNGDGSFTQNQKNGTVLQTFASYQSPNAQNMNLDLSSFQFDPSLFGTYRETQEAIIGDGEFSGGLYDDYLNLNEFENSPLNASTSFARKATPVPPPQPLLEKTQSEDKLLRLDSSEPSPVPKKLDDQNMMTCNKMWEQLSTCPKFKEGELDIDSLCSELSKKATCSERGAVIPKAEWEAALWRLVGQENPADSASPSSTR